MERIGIEPVEIWAGGKRVKSIWQPGVVNPYLSRHLIIPVRAVIGFWNVDEVPLKTKAKASGLSAGEFIALNRMLCESSVSAVEFCRKYGLPASASVPLQEKLYCPGCRRWIVSLPCICCWDGVADDDPDVQT